MKNAMAKRSLLAVTVSFLLIVGCTSGDGSSSFSGEDFPTPGGAGSPPAGEASSAPDVQATINAAVEATVKAAIGATVQAAVDATITTPPTSSSGSGPSSTPPDDLPVGPSDEQQVLLTPTPARLSKLTGENCPRFEVMVGVDEDGTPRCAEPYNAEVIAEGIATQRYDTWVNLENGQSWVPLAGGDINIRVNANLRSVVPWTLDTWEGLVGPIYFGENSIADMPSKKTCAATMGVLSFGNITEADIGRWYCVRTVGGNLARVKIVELQDPAIENSTWTIDFTTWY